VALSQARILYQNHSGDYPQVILTIPVTCRTDTNAPFIFCTAEKSFVAFFIHYITCIA
jgi:hypothetical protein